MHSDRTNSGPKMLVVGVIALLFCLGHACGPEPERVTGLMPEGRDLGEAKSVQEAVLANGLGVDAKPAVMRVVNKAEEVLAEVDVVPTAGFSFRVTMDSRTKRLGVPLKFGVGSSRPGPAGDAMLDSDPVHQGVLESGESFEATLEFDARATKLWVRVEEPGKAQIKSLRTIGEGRTNLSLQAKTGATARGVVVSADGVPPSNGRPRLYPDKGKQLGGRMQGDGRFEAHYSGSGKGRVSIDALEQGAAELEIEGLDSESPPQDLVIELQPGESLGGVLVDGDGRPVPGTKVLVINEAKLKNYKGRKTNVTSRYRGVEPGGREGDFGVTDASGRFEAQGLEPADYYVLVMPEGSTRWGLLEEEPKRSGRVDYTFPMEARRLRVKLARPEGGFAEFDPSRSYRAQTGEDVLRPLQEELRVVLHPLGDSNNGSSFRARWHPTGDPTVWEVSLAAAVRYKLEAASLRRPAASVEVDFLPTETMREQVLKLSPLIQPGRLQVTVIDPPGSESVTGYGFYLRVDDSPNLPSVSYIARLHGTEGEPFDAKFELPPGRYSIVAKPQRKGSYRGSQVILPSSASQWVDVVSGGSQVLTLETEARGLVRLKCLTARSFEAVEFHDRHSGELLATFDEFGGSSWRADYQFLAPGDYRLVSGVGHEATSFDFDLSHGESLDLTWSKNPEPPADGVPSGIWKSGKTR